jgi:hypothetical protein
VATVCAEKQAASPHLENTRPIISMTAAVEKARGGGGGKIAPTDVSEAMSPSLRLVD